MTRFLWVFSFFLLSSRSWAGDVAGNGGDVVRCELGGAVTYRLLDYYESPLSNELGSPSWDPITKALYAVDRVKILDPQRYGMYEKSIRTFYDNVDRWIDEGPGLEDIDDSGDVKLPLSCKLVQAAIRRKTFHPSIKPYLIDLRIWNQLTADDRAGLILHEIVYGEMFQLGHRTSVKARRYNSLLSATQFEGMEAATYASVVGELFRPIYPPVFRAEEFDVNALPGEQFHLELRSLLQYPVEGALRWDTLEALPSWLTLAQEALNGVPGQELSGREFELNLVVRGAKGAIAKLRIHVR